MKTIYKLLFVSAAITGGATIPVAAADVPSYHYGETGELDLYHWTGFYFGPGAGGIMESTEVRYDSPTNGNLFRDMESSSWLAGGQIGYNVDFAGPYVAGIEADLFATGARETSSPCFVGITVTCSATAKLPWLATVRARFGYGWGRTLTYVTGGMALASLNYAIDLNGVRAKKKDIALGWTVGAGAEYRIDPRWSIKAEYLYSRFELKAFNNFPTIGERTSFKAHQHSLRAGVNYHF